MGQAQHTSAASALEGCVITALAKDAMLAALHEHPEPSQMSIAFLPASSDGIEAGLIDRLLNSSEKRLARRHLLMEKDGHNGSPQPVMPKISRESAAKIIGTTNGQFCTDSTARRPISFVELTYRKLQS
jgi:CRP/FNR family transcriptional regulator, cyclic AMP receptor protein